MVCNKVLNIKYLVHYLYFSFTENYGLHTEEASTALQNLNKLKELEVQESLTQNKYFQEIASMTGEH